MFVAVVLRFGPRHHLRVLAGWGSVFTCPVLPVLATGWALAGQTEVRQGGADLLCTVVQYHRGALVCVHLVFII
jgi:hypothetical protein